MTKNQYFLFVTLLVATIVALITTALLLIQNNLLTI